MAEPTVRVVLTWDDERRTEIEVPPDETILEAAYAAGIDHRSGCEAGRCASCVGRLVRGSVEYVNEPRALTDDQLDQEFVLLCSAVPTDRCEIEVGTSVLTEAFPGLW
jgi:ferredoxin